MSEIATKHSPIADDLIVARALPAYLPRRRKIDLHGPDGTMMNIRWLDADGNSVGEPAQGASARGFKPPQVTAPEAASYAVMVIYLPGGTMSRSVLRIE